MTTRDLTPNTSERIEMLLAHEVSLGREQMAISLASTDAPLDACIRVLASLPRDPNSRAVASQAAAIFSRIGSRFSPQSVQMRASPTMATRRPHHEGTP